MKPITYLVGDATDPEGVRPVIIAHCCNDAGIWGAGFVLALSKRWPKAEQEYRAWAREMKPGNLPLGSARLVEVDTDIFVANIIGQRGVGLTNGLPPLRYDALRNGLAMVYDFSWHTGASVHMPRIGCGLAGGNWANVQMIIEEELCAKDVPVFVYDLPQKEVAA